MNIALLLAAGIDPTFRMDIPKQFVNVYNRPIIVYTMEIFQSHPEIDAMMVACLKGWENMVAAYAKQFGITKLKWVIQGGGTGQETSKIATDNLMESCSADDIIVIHDAIRPMVSHEIISDSIYTCKKKGMGVAAVTSMDNVMMTDDGITGRLSISRYAFRRIQTPQTFYLGELKKAHEEALEKGIVSENDTNNMISRLGRNVNFSKGSDLNLKINTVEDVAMFKALYAMKNGDI
ncbi:MAG: 2-C-methyl-D-erythritol 4-phosphate cytidylyltransferase [Lachnospiraceae bacterium]|nr:2-C-methyl-D-erythritol 4-phosphate cytidylyltransferase [Lachnospiraceae bacterium]